MSPAVPGAEVPQQVKGLDCRLRGLVTRGQGLVAGKGESLAL